MAIYGPNNPYLSPMPGLGIPPGLPGGGPAGAGLPGGGVQTGLPAGGGGPGTVPSPGMEPKVGGGGGGFLDSVLGFLGEGENLAGLAQLLGSGASIYGAHREGQRADEMIEEEREQRERRQRRHESLAPFYLSLLQQAGGGG
ncbi:MAG: hypothetical protein ACODAE_07685 [Gemmatimonadota bacterium]